jgi:glycosyltransferase involved in cell wall biosynthesis
MRLCFVIPVFNEAPTLRELAAGIQRHSQPWPSRLLFIDDGSSDATLEILRELRASHSEIDFIRMRRNLGKTRALAVGFARADADLVITMDGDLQDRPEEIPALIAKYQEGFDLVCGWKAARQDPGHKVALSRVYNRCLAAMFGISLHDVNTGFKAIRADLARRLPLFGDMHRMMAVFAAQCGYRVAEIPVEHAPRLHGSSKYGLGRYYRGVMDAVLAWLLTRGGNTASVRKRCFMVALILFFVGGIATGAGVALEPLAWRCVYAVLGALAWLVSGGMLALASFVLPLGEWLHMKMVADALERDIEEEALG